MLILNNPIFCIF